MKNNYQLKHRLFPRYDINKIDHSEIEIFFKHENTEFTDLQLVDASLGGLKLSSSNKFTVADKKYSIIVKTFNKEHCHQGRLVWTIKSEKYYAGIELHFDDFKIFQNWLDYVKHLHSNIF